MNNKYIEFVNKYIKLRKWDNETGLLVLLDEIIDYMAGEIL